MNQNLLHDLYLPYDLTSFKSQVMLIDSEALKTNPLGDPSSRPNFLLVPRDLEGPMPVFFHLSGYYSTGFQSFDVRRFEKNIPQWIDGDTASGRIQKALHVFVDGMTYWGGSQFLDSEGSGNYSTYILEELCPAIAKTFPTQEGWTVIGGSSGGYGALHLISQKDSPFQRAIAIAPDSFFEGSLLPELRTAAPQLAKYTNFQELRTEVESGTLNGKRSFFNLVNVTAMAHCYGSQRSLSSYEWPVDLHSGAVNPVLWKEWLEKDPLIFLPKATSVLREKQVILDVGKYDEYSLQMGSRQIEALLKKLGVTTELFEFSGTHRGLSERRRVRLQGLL